MEYDELLKEFAQWANPFYSWILAFNLQLESLDDRQASEEAQEQVKSIETLRKLRSIEAKCKEVEEKQETVKKIKGLDDKLSDTRFKVCAHKTEALKLYTGCNSADLCQQMKKLQQRINALHKKIGM